MDRRAAALGVRMGLLCLALAGCSTVARVGRWVGDTAADAVEDGGVAAGVAGTTELAGPGIGIVSAWAWKWLIEPITAALFGSRRTREPIPSDTPGGAGGDSVPLGETMMFGFSMQELLMFAGLGVFLWAGGGTWLRRRFKQQVEKRDQQKETELARMRDRLEQQEREIQRLWDTLNRKQ